MFLYTNNDWSKINLENNPIYYSTENDKILNNINFTKEVKDLYTENYKTLLKEIKQGMKNKGKDFSCLWILELNIV